MASAPKITTRIDAELFDAARDAVGRPDIDVHTLLRAGLAVIAGVPVDAALQSARRRRGPRPRTEAAA